MVAEEKGRCEEESEGLKRKGLKVGQLAFIEDMRAAIAWLKDN